MELRSYSSASLPSVSDFCSLSAGVRVSVVLLLWRLVPLQRSSLWHQRPAVSILPQSSAQQHLLPAAFCPASGKPICWVAKTQRNVPLWDLLLCNNAVCVYRKNRCSAVTSVDFTSCMLENGQNTKSCIIKLTSRPLSLVDSNLEPRYVSSLHNPDRVCQIIIPSSLFWKIIAKRKKKLI